MLTLSAFSSLAQLGAGLALALSIFLEPIAYRERKLRDALDRALLRIPRDGSEKSKERQNAVWAHIIDLNEAAKSAHRLARVPLAVVIIGAAVNFVVLLMATIAPDAEVSDWWCWMLLATCILPVAAGTTWLIGIAQWKIGLLERSMQLEG